MILNLNDISFKPYGTVSDSGQPLITSYAQGQRISVVKNSTINKLYCWKEYVHLEVMDGVALLCVCGSSEENQKVIFLLDKTVTIYPGILYSVFTLYGECRIKTIYSKGCSPFSIDCSFDYPPLEMESDLHIGKIHTLFYQEKKADFRFKGEKHDFWEFTCVDKGSLYTNVDGTACRLEKGDAVFYGCGQYHIQKAYGTESVCFTTVTFDMDFSNSDCLSNRKFKTDAGLRDKLSSLLDEAGHNRLYSNDMAICILKEIVIGMLRLSDDKSFSYNRGSYTTLRSENETIDKCIRYIKANITNRLTVGDIASCIPISPSHLSVLFKKHTGMSIMKYANEYRLQLSRKLIRSTDRSLTRIAEETGFNTIHYFSNCFKDRFKIRPSEYARSVSSRLNP